MASVETPLEQHVTAIKLSLDQNRVQVELGELGNHKWGPPRRILFEPLGGELGPAPTVQGKLEIAENQWGKAFRSVDLRVRAHIVAESHTALWVLWQNVVVASWQSLQSNSVATEFDLSPVDHGVASHLYDGARALTQDFVWTLNMFDRIVDLPAYADDVPGIVGLGDLVPMEEFTNAVDFLDHDEADPEP